jgi:hypothetical protein
VEASNMMDKQNELIDLACQWENMNAAYIEQRMTLWDGNRGLLFVGPDDRTSGTIKFMLDYFQPDAVLTFDIQDQDQWRSHDHFPSF